MQIYQIIQREKNSDRLQFWHCFFRYSAMKKAARLASNFTGLDEGPDGDILAQFINPRAPGYFVTVLVAHLTFLEPWMTIKRWLRKIGRSQNLIEDKNGNSKGSIWKHGRAWINPSGLHSERGLDFELEWRLFSKRFSVGLDIADGERALGIHICLYLFSFYLNLEHNRLKRWLQAKTKRPDEKYGNGREIGMHWTGGGLFVHLWSDPMEWRATDPKWWQFSIHPADMLLGKAKYASQELFKEIVGVPMPERVYSAVVQIKEDSWTRPRWPFPLKIRRAHIECEEGIPHPGKGENSWDCGEDATYGLTTPASTVSEAVLKLQKSVMDKRERRAGKNWIPETKRA